MKMPARMVSRWVPGGGHTVAWARMVKKAANRELKNITSEPEPDDDPDGQHRRLVGAVALAGGDRRVGGEGLSHAVFLVDRKLEGPTQAGDASERRPPGAAGPDSGP